MIKKIAHLSLMVACLFTGKIAKAQNSANPTIHTDKITIARDSYGVPHIFAPTDPEVAYGIAWAHSEDDFKTIQTLLLTGKGKLSTYMGKKGAPIDFVVGLLNTRALVDAQINSMDPKFLQLVKGYLMGLEAYAKAHPNEVLNKYVFPVSVEEYLSSTVFSVAVFCGFMGQFWGKSSRKRRFQRPFPLTVSHRWLSCVALATPCS